MVQLVKRRVKIQITFILNYCLPLIMIIINDHGENILSFISPASQSIVSILTHCVCVCEPLLFHSPCYYIIVIVCLD
ncbi:hypothetical protein BLA29_008901 [Euroglyphus maynei]|uniref:Uncharacterized protein n=1 Tax=Euroglyphus maynei TaxID=6958 RepID=A0A1Y3BTR2_EURMA|nr:hypothetical protein BLA29_008901 [Euroglyphus maynei]